MIKYPVVEIFDSIQGEGAMMGMPVTFIRFAGCNLACPWCDSKETWQQPCRHEHIEYDDINEMRSANMHCVACGAEGSGEDLKNLTIPTKGYTWVPVEDIVGKCNKDIVVLTGGEPCIQELEPLVEALHKLEKFICIETNGTLATPEGLDWVVCSPKPPEYLIHSNCFFDELKYVADENLTIDCIPEDMMQKSAGSIWIQPCDYADNKIATKKSYAKVVNMVMTNKSLRAGIQLHKIINVK